MRYFVLLMGLLVFATACTTAVQKEVADTMMEEPTGNAVMEEPTMEDKAMEDNSMEESHEEPGAMMEDTKEEPAMMESFSGNVLAGKKTKYIEFNQADYEKALAEGKTIMLYFYAKWCPSCKAEQPRIHDGFEMLSDDDIVGFRVNYKDGDTDSYEEGLAKKYGITYQHTKVVLKNGERVLKSPESWSADRYKEELSNV